MVKFCISYHTEWDLLSWDKLSLFPSCIRRSIPNFHKEQYFFQNYYSDHIKDGDRCMPQGRFSSPMCFTTFSRKECVQRNCRALSLEETVCIWDCVQYSLFRAVASLLYHDTCIIQSAKITIESQQEQEWVTWRRVNRINHQE